MDIRTTGSHMATRFTAYEAPRVESVLTSDELEREVFYAGTGIISCGGGRANGHRNNIGGHGNNGVGSGGCDNGYGNGGGNINHP